MHRGGSSNNKALLAQWQCETCTLLNNIRLKQCTLCRSPRPASCRRQQSVPASSTNPFSAPHSRQQRQQQQQQQQGTTAARPHRPPCLSLSPPSSSSAASPSLTPPPSTSDRGTSPSSVVLLVDSDDEEEAQQQQQHQQHQQSVNGEENWHAAEFGKQPRKAKMQGNKRATARVGTALALNTPPRQPAPTSRSKRANPRETSAGLPKTKRGKAATRRASSTSAPGPSSGSKAASGATHALSTMLVRGARVDWPQTQPEGWPKPLGELTVAAFPSRTLSKHDLRCGCAVTLGRPARAASALPKTRSRSTPTATGSSSSPTASTFTSSAARGRLSRTRQKEDVSIRFRHHGMDLGRLPLDVCRWATPLLECNAIRMKGTCIYAPTKLTPREPVILSVTLLANYAWFSRPPRTFGARGKARQSGARPKTTTTTTGRAADAERTTGGDTDAADDVTSLSGDDDNGDDNDDDDDDDDDTRDALRRAWRACLSSVGLEQQAPPSAAGVAGSERSSHEPRGGAAASGGEKDIMGQDARPAPEHGECASRRTSLQEGGRPHRDQRKQSGAGDAAEGAGETKEEQVALDDAEETDRRDADDDNSEEGLRDLEYVCDRMGQVDATLEEVDPPQGAMTCTLRPYQKQALGWMIEREELTHSSAKSKDQLHPMYKQLAFPDGTPLYWSDSMCVLTTVFPPASEQFRGGILADAMGLGKTVQALALIATLRAAPSFPHRPVRRGQTQRHQHQHQQAEGGRGTATTVSASAETGSDMSMDAYLASLEKTATPQTSGYDAGSAITGNAPRASDATATRSSPLADPMGARAVGSSQTHNFVPKRVRRVRGRFACRATLIVCPMSLVSQWEAECRQHLTDAQVLVYYGAGRTRDLLDDATRADVIITTYGVVTSEGFRQQRPSTRVPRSSLPTRAAADIAAGNGSSAGGVDEDSASLTLFSFHFWRIILDEAHMIKNRNTVGARACYRLNSERRWTMTGTPLQNHLQDVFSLLKFLHLEPWCSWSVWREHIQSVFDEDEDKAVQRLQMVLQPILLRRTKSTRDRHGNPILSLPSSNVDVRELVMSPAERDFYEAILSRSKRKFREFEMTGKVFANYTNILELLLRLRQACDHPLLTLRDTPSSDTDGASHRGAGGRGLAARTFSDIDRLIDAYLSDSGDAREHKREEEEEDEEDEQRQRRRQTSEDNVPSDRANDRRAESRENGRDDSTASATRRGNGCGSGRTDEFGRNSEGSNGSSARDGDACGDADNGRVAGREHGNRVSHKAAYAQHKRAELAAFLQRRSAKMSECCICLDTVDKPVVTPCLHVGCSPCFHDVIGKFGECPVCRKAVSVSSLMLVERPANDADEETTDTCGDGGDDKCTDTREAGASSSTTKEPFKYSTKIRAVLEELSAMREADASNKCIVFSQWTSMLDLIQRAVEAAGYNAARLDGSLSQAGRARALKHFSSDPKCTVFLMTLRSGGVGLNLTAASHVLLVDPWWNPSVEEQAIDRVHRIGQNKQVCVKRFIMLDSVEEKIRVLQARKRQLVQNALATTNAASTAGDTEQRLADLRLLFGFA